ncbi:L-seryl-tRNA(Sec) kinase-like [Clavelina lepadiformis]|uniref:L-seryl-tRNA(Sec) kinase-like n=1 Tax=Clavelina lepadiformis TaxID=159417 RepID=UPI004042C6C8
MSKACICVLCGLPGSGKTTFCSSLIKSELHQYQFIHVCYDALIPWIDFKDPRDIHAWKARRQLVLHFVHNVLQFFLSGNIDMKILQVQTLVEKEVNRVLLQTEKLIKSAMTKNVVILVDDNMQFREMRYEYCQLSRQLNTGFAILYMACPLLICQQRNESRSSESIVKNQSFLRIQAQMELPGTSQCKWESNYCEVDTSTIDDDVLNKVAVLLDHAFANPMQNINLVDHKLAEHTRLVNMNSLTHQADIVLRRLCGEVLKHELSPQCLAPKLSLAKKMVLQEIKCGNMHENDYLTHTRHIDQEKLTLRLRNLLTGYLEELNLS